MKKVLLFASLLFTFAFTTGCSPSQESEMATVLQGALTNFTQNRSLTEQFVRDVKSRLDPADPAYIQAMESYQEARETYNRYLDGLETGQRKVASRSLRSASPIAVENAAADFISDASRAMRPSEVRHRGDFQRAVVVPEQLQSIFSRLPRKTREEMIDQFDGQIRWRSWSQL